MEPEPLPKSLLPLNYDVLSNICQIVDEMSHISTTVQSKARALSALRAFGPRTSLEDLWVGDTRFEFLRDENSLVIDFVRHEEERRERVAGHVDA
jgi:hypothetical protein